MMHPDEQIVCRRDVSVIISSVHCLLHKMHKEIIFSEIINVLVVFPHSIPQLKSI
jgi:hypothetical protein